MQKTLRRFFGLRENPFNVTPDPRFLVLTDHMRRTLAELTYAIETHKGLVVLTGEVGTGKTLLVRHLLDYIQRAKMPHALIFNPNLGVRDFFNLVLPEFGLSPRPNVAPVAQLRDWLALSGGGHRDNAVLIVDEAQGLRLEVLEEIRLLSNSEPSKGKSLQVILAGQPELDEKLRRPEFRAIRNRVSIRCTTRPLSRAEVDAYIAGRLRAAGATAEIAFPNEAANLLYFYSRGIPRLLNVLCEHSLLRAYSRRMKSVSAQIIEEVAHSLQVDDLKPLTAFMPVAPATAPSAAVSGERTRGDIEAPPEEVPKVVRIDKMPVPIELPQRLTPAPANARDAGPPKPALHRFTTQDIPGLAKAASTTARSQVEEQIRSHSESLDELLSSAVGGFAPRAPALSAEVPANAAVDPAGTEEHRVRLHAVPRRMAAGVGRAKSYVHAAVQRAQSAAQRSAQGARSAASRAKSSLSRGGASIAARSCEGWAALGSSAHSLSHRADKVIESLWRAAAPLVSIAATAARERFAKFPSGPAFLQRYDALCRWLQQPMQLGRMRRVVSQRQA
jgi:general secretion pathway protein A